MVVVPETVGCVGVLWVRHGAEVRDSEYDGGQRVAKIELVNHHGMEMICTVVETAENLR